MSNSFPSQQSSSPAGGNSVASAPARNESHIESWTRWWIPEEQWASADTDQDFLNDYGTSATAEQLFGEEIQGIAPLTQWKNEPFLLLLGRPGSGKSEEMQRAQAGGWLGLSLPIIAKEVAHDPVASLDRLVARHQPAPGTRLIIDGLDEALLVNANFSERLQSWFRERMTFGGPPDLKLAITCRWADWPRGPVESLASLWTSHPVKLVLGPLRRKDAANTLKSRLGDEKAEAFWRQMHTHHLVPLACWPQSFLAMVEEFAASGRVARSHTEAMEAEIRRRCVLADSRDDRLRRERSVHDAEWRQRVAGRIAALLTFTGRQSFTLDPAGSSSVLSVTDITTDAPEAFGQSRRDVTVADVDSVIAHSSLLRQTENGHTFAHQVYQEVLTAQWLHAQQTDVRRLSQLFGFLENGQWHPFPNLVAVAATLAAKPKQRRFREFLLAHDPLVLLRLDAVALSESERRELFQALLKRTAEIGIVDRGEHHAHWPSHKYKEATADIATLLRDPNTHEAAKELALNAARGMELTDLAPALWEVYPEASSRSKKEIARALHELASHRSETNWRAVLDGQIPIDGDGMLLGAALEYMVPKHMSLGEAVHWIVPKRHFEVLGHYQIVVDQMKKHLVVADVPAVLAQLSRQRRDPLEGEFVSEMRQTALRLAFTTFDDPVIREALGKFWLACLGRHERPHHDDHGQWRGAEIGIESDELRRKVAAFLIKHPRLLGSRTAAYCMASDFMLEGSDLRWLLTELLAADEPDEWRYALPASHFLWEPAARAEVRDLLPAAWAKSAELQRQLPQPHAGESLEDAFLRVRAEGERQRAAREAQLEAEMQQHREQRAKSEADYEAACRSWDADGKLVWPQIFYLLGNRGHFGAGGMINFEALEKVRPDEDWIRAAARRYLLELPNHCDPAEGDAGMWGVLALGLWTGELGSGGALDDAVRHHWLPVFVLARFAHGLGKYPAAISCEHFASLFPAEFPSAFSWSYAQQYAAGSSMEEFKPLLPLWTPEITREAVRILCDSPVSARGFVNAFRHLATVSMESAMEVGRHWLAADRMPQDEEQKAALLGACALFSGGALWTGIKEHFSGESGQAAFRHAIARGSDRLWAHDTVDFSDWPGTALREFAEALRDICPPKAARNRGGFEWKEVTAEDRAEELRNQAYTAATNRGIKLDRTQPQVANADDAAVAQRSTSWQQRAASQIRAAQAWQPLPPAELLDLATRPLARLARTADELLAAVVECLEAYEAELIRNRWDELWNEVKTKDKQHLRKAKDEKRIARHICDWLKEYLKIPALREPEMPNASRADIHLCGPVNPAGQPLALVIEVKKVRKGNALERATAMRTQLLERYLTPNHAAEGWTHGLYLVAWTPEPESALASDEALEKARESLRKEAQRLSKPPFTVHSMVLDVRYGRQDG